MDHINEHAPWIAVDFDGTLAHYEHWAGPAVLGAPIQPMVDRVKGWLAEGKQVRIFTARVWPLLHVPVTPNSPFNDVWRSYVDLSSSVERRIEAQTAVTAIRDWCEEHIGQMLPVTCVKDIHMVELYDDRAVQVEANTGRLIGASTRGL